MDDISIDNLPEGMTFEPVKGLTAGGLVARDLATHPVMRRPSRHFANCSFDRMADNTMLSMHLARIEPGGYKCRHRHFDETTSYVVAGFGWSVFRQAEEAEPVRIDWRAGDLFAIPCNAWHQQFNASNSDYARHVSFRNSPVMNAAVLGPKAKKEEILYNRDARFFDRFADEPDYFMRREEIAPGVVRTNFVSQVVDEPLPETDGAWGDGVAMQHYLMGGQRMLDVVLIGIRQGGQMRPHRAIAEEAFLVLAGEGRSEVWDDTGRRGVAEWSAGDMVSPPFNAWRSHHATSEARLLMVRNIVIERALGLRVGKVGHLEALPVRLPDRIEPGRWRA